MELRVLHYFLAIAREENMTRAAQMLHISQPALSRQMMQLEAELGVKLFTRSNHNIVLTEDGLLLKRRAQELLSLADKTKRDFLHRDTELAGEITIGSGEFRSTRELAKAMVAFRNKHPLVQFRIYSGNADNVQDYIERGLLDLGVMGEPVDIRKYEFVPMPVKEEWGVLVREDSPLARKEYIEPADLMGISLVTGSRDFHGELIRWFGELYDKLEIAAVGNLLYNEAMLVGNGAVVIVQRAHDLLDPAQVLHLERGDEKVALNSVSIFLVLIQKGVGHEAVSQIGGGTVLRAEAPLGLFPVGAVQKNASGPQRADVPLFILRPHQGIFFIVVVGPHRVPIYGGDLLRRGVFCQSSGYQAQRQNERQEYTEKFAFFHYEITSFVAPLPYRKFIRSSITVL